MLPNNSKFLHPEELRQYQGMLIQHRKDTFLASRWAAKEAAYKAFSKYRIPFPDIKIVSGAKSRPELQFEGRALEVATELKVGDTFLSISHDTDYATATVILTRQAPTL